MSSISNVSSSLTYLDIQARAANAEASRAARASDAAQARSDQTQAVQADVAQAADAASSTNATDAAFPQPIDTSITSDHTTLPLENPGHSGTTLTDLRTNLETALKSAEDTGTDGRTAVIGVLQDAGVDPVALQREITPTVAVDGVPVAPISVNGSLPGGVNVAGTIAPNDSVNAADPTSATFDAAALQASTSASALDPLLDGTGIDATTFKSSLTSILDSGSTDVAPLFAAAAVGSSLDLSK